MKKVTSKKKHRKIKHTFKFADCISNIDALEVAEKNVSRCIYAYYKMCEVRRGA